MRSVVFLGSCDTDVVKNSLPAFLTKVKSACEIPDTCEPVILSSRPHLASLPCIHGYPEYFVSLCRRYGLLKNERVTLLSPMDQMVSIQLCLAEKNKQDTGDFDVESSVVLQAFKDINNQKLVPDYTITSCTEESGILYQHFLDCCNYDTGDFDIESSVVLQAVKDINNQKLVPDYTITSCTEESGICELYQHFLDCCNCVDLGHIYTMVTRESETNDAVKQHLADQVFLVIGVPTSPVERALLEFLCQDSVVRLASVEVPLDAENEMTVTCSDDTLENILSNDARVSTVKKPLSLTEAFVRHVYLSYLELLVKSRSELALARVFNVPERELTKQAFVRHVYLSYLELLVNSRSELALARVFNVPERELTHQAFTDLKHASQEKNMTMYQTVTSFVMKLRLGGKGYASDLSTSALGPHVKGLGELVSLMHRMETVLEEETDIRAACRRVINIVKKEITKCRDSRIRVSSVESVADMLKARIGDIIDNLDTRLLKTPDKAPANGGSLTSRRSRKALRHLLDKLATGDDDMSALDHLTDIYSSQRTPIRFQSLLSQFRSPEEELEVTSPDNKFTSSLSDRVMNKINKQATPVYAKRYKSTMDWAEPVHQVGLQESNDIFSNSQVYVIPSKTIVHAGSKLTSGEANKVLESLLDQENLPAGDVPLAPISRPAKSTTSNKTGNQPAEKKKKPAAEKQSKKRPAESETQSSQAQKKKKVEQPKSVRRKLLPQVKGQQKLGNFFRV